jgi:hypothetical protein
MQPQHDGELQDRQVTDAPRSALFDLGATRLATGTHDGGVSAFEMQRKLLWSENLTDNAKFWEIEQRFETMEIHEQGFLLLALMFIQNFARNPVLVNNRLSAASYLTQPLASNLAKSL